MCILVVIHVLTLGAHTQQGYSGLVVCVCVGLSVTALAATAFVLGP